VSFDYYAMNRDTRARVTEWARERGWEQPSTILKPLLASLLYRHRLSLICEQIDLVTDRLFVIHDAIDRAIGEGNLVAIVLLKERLGEEKTKLEALGRLLEKENPMRKGNEDTDRQIANAREYPIEELLSSYGCVVKFRRCRCPVHEGKNPSSLEVKGNRGRCHSCSWTGDSIDLVMKMESCSFMEAVQKLQ
jgi:hypothetical protein